MHDAPRLVSAKTSLAGGITISPRSSGPHEPPTSDLSRGIVTDWREPRFRKRLLKWLPRIPAPTVTRTTSLMTSLSRPHLGLIPSVRPAVRAARGDVGKQGHVIAAAPDWRLTQSDRSQLLQSQGNTTGTPLPRCLAIARISIIRSQARSARQAKPDPQDVHGIHLE